MILNSPYISGSLTVTGNTTIQGQLTVTGSLSGTASLASNSLLLQGTGSTGFATTASVLQVSSSQQQISSSLLQVSASYISLSGSYNTFSGSASTRITANSSSIQQISSSQQQISASLLNVIANYATTGSNSFRANQSITGSLVVSSTITAQTLVVQTVTSSIVYSSGSNLFGSALTDRQTFTGSVNITGSQTVFGNVGIGVTSPTGSLSIKAEVTNTPTIAFQNSLGGPNSAISNYASAVQTFTVIGTNVYVNSAAGLARFNTSYEGSGITFDEGIIRFSTGTTSITPTIRMNIASNGKISINAPTTADAFNVQGANNYWTSIFTSGTTTSQAYGVYIKAGTNASDVSFLIQNTSGTDILRILGTGTTTFSGGVTTSGNVSATEIYANSSINMLNGYVRLRNAANTATYGLFIQKAIWIGSGTDYSPAIAAETGYGIYTYTNGATSPSGPYVSPGGTTWTNGSSDARKKKNFETTQGLAEVLQIEPIKYHFNEDDDNSKKRLGFKAQNILPLIPEMVLEKDEFAEDGSPYLTVTPDYILPVLVKAIQELQAQITELKNK